MIKKLFFTATLLVPCLAYGIDPSANLSVQVVPPGSTPSVPAGAAAAGFTTQALNSDFTEPLPSNWLGGCPNGANGQPVTGYFNDDTGHTWWLNLWWSQSYQNCNTKQITDPVYGRLVVDMPWTVDNAHTAQGTVIQSASWDYNRDGKAVCSNGNCRGGQGTANDFPPNAYFEIVARMTPALPGAYFVMNTWPSLAMSDSNRGGIELDVIETDGNVLSSYSSVVHNWGAGGKANCIWDTAFCHNSPLPANFDLTQFHTYAGRITSNGQTSSDGSTQSLCGYLDNVFVRCIPQPGGVTTDNAQERLFLIVQNACNWWNYNGVCTQGQVQHLYIKSIRVWSCADWKTTQCNGKVLTGAP
jgi:hypothetical protein